MKVSAFKQQFAIVSLYLKHQQKQFLKFMKSQVSFQVKNKHQLLRMTAFDISEAQRKVMKGKEFGAFRGTILFGFPLSFPQLFTWLSYPFCRRLNVT